MDSRPSGREERADARAGSRAGGAGVPENPYPGSPATFFVSLGRSRSVQSLQRYEALKKNPRFVSRKRSAGSYWPSRQASFS
jgi:hypothetical protein